MTLAETIVAVRADSRQRDTCCPSHEDRRASLSVGRGDDGRVLLKCHAGCSAETMVAAAGLRMADLFPQQREGGRSISPDHTATVQRGCTLAAYAAAKRLPIDFLGTLGVCEISYLRAPAVRMPTFDEHGTEIGACFRVALTGDRFRWRRGAKAGVWGVDRLEAARATDEIVIVEGASDFQTLTYHGIPAYGIPGASSWLEARDAPRLAGLRRIYVVLEPDSGGSTLLRTLGTSRLAGLIHIISLGHKDVSALHCAAPHKFLARYREARAAARPLAAVLAEAEASVHVELLAKCRELAHAPNILTLFTDTIEAAGVVGERRATQLLYLAATSRLLARPVSIVIKGPSAGGKSYLVERVLQFFPTEAYYALTGMSERLLAYDDEPLKHRMLVIQEAAGLAGNFSSCLVRSLLSEGKVRYKTVEKTRDGLRPRLIEREGPTGLIVTTTAVSLHPENETRLLSIPVTDTQEQTQAILQSLAGDRPDTTATTLDRWRDFQRWLETGDRQVVIPYAPRLATQIPPAAVRLRRDFSVVLGLIQACALLHRATRPRDTAGRIVATIADYVSVRAVLADLLADAVERAVPTTTREVVDALQALAGAGGETTHAKVAVYLKLDRSAAWRRVQVAINYGYIVNLEDRRGRTARLQIGVPVPADQTLLPPPDALALDGCRVASASEGIDTPLPVSSTDVQDGLVAPLSERSTLDTSNVERFDL
ncbi:MAG: hypothetical protein HYX76_08460 [Acidobacteria bacterium]|nr:hypothetical protein [Acidobacteriota bacterium]